MVYCEILGQESEININTKNPEFIEWKWIEIEKLPSVIVAFKNIFMKDCLPKSKNLLINFLKSIYFIR